MAERKAAQEAVARRAAEKGAAAEARARTEEQGRLLEVQAAIVQAKEAQLRAEQQQPLQQSSSQPPPPQQQQPQQQQQQQMAPREPPAVREQPVGAAGASFRPVGILKQSTAVPESIAPTDRRTARPTTTALERRAPLPPPHPPRHHQLESDEATRRLQQAEAEARKGRQAAEAKASAALVHVEQLQEQLQASLQARRQAEARAAASQRAAERAQAALLARAHAGALPPEAQPWSMQPDAEPWRERHPPGGPPPVPRTPPQPPPQPPQPPQGLLPQGEGEPTEPGPRLPSRQAFTPSGVNLGKPLSPPPPSAAAAAAELLGVEGTKIDQLAQLANQLKQAEARVSSLQAELEQLRGARDAAEARAASLEAEHAQAIAAAVERAVGEEAQRRAKLSEELHAREERLVASADEKLRDLSTEIV